MIESSLILADLGGKVAEVSERFGIQWSLLIAQAINFLIVLYVLYRFALKPVLATLDKRQAEIKAGLDYAEEMKRKLADAEEKQKQMLKDASRQAKKSIEEARQAAKEYQEKQTRDANERAAALVKKAEESIEMERRKMLAEVREEISRLVVMTTSRVLGKELSEEERNRFLNAASEDLRKN